jgi:hypothetical protein
MNCGNGEGCGRKKMKPDEAVKFAVQCDLTEWSLKDAEIKIGHLLAENRMPSDTPIAYLLTTSIDGVPDYRKIIASKLKKSSQERSKENNMPLYVFVESLPHILHKVDNDYAQDEWSLTGFGCIKEGNSMKPFQRTIWSEGA